MLPHYQLEQYQKALFSDVISEQIFSTDWGQMFSQQQLKTLVQYMDLYEIPAGNLLFREGDIDNDFILVLTGLINISKLHKGKGMINLIQYQPGDYFGEIALIDNMRRSATATTEKTSRLIYLKQERLIAMEDKQPRLACLVLKKMMLGLALRLRNTTARLTG